MFHGRRHQIEQFLSGLHCFRHGRKKEQTHAALGGQWNDFQVGGNNGRERPFTAGKNVNQIVGFIHGPRERVAGPTLQKSRRKSLGNLQRIERKQVFQQKPLALQVFAARADLQHLPVSHDNSQFGDVHSGCAIKRSMRAG